MRNSYFCSLKLRKDEKKDCFDGVDADGSPLFGAC